MQINSFWKIDTNGFSSLKNDTNGFSSLKNLSICRINLNRTILILYKENERNKINWRLDDSQIRGIILRKSLAG